MPSIVTLSLMKTGTRPAILSLSAHPIEGKRIPPTLEEIAADISSSCVQCSLKAPIFSLAGAWWLIAYEMARQLLAAGQEDRTC